MDRRVFLAVILTAIVIVVTPLLFPGSRPPVSRDSTGADSGYVAGAPNGTAQPKPGSSAATAIASPTGSIAPATPASGTQVVIGDSLSVTSPHMTVWYGTDMAAPFRVALTDYASREPTEDGGRVQLRTVQPTALLGYRVTLGDSAFDLTNAKFSAATTGGAQPTGVTFRGAVEGHAVSIDYGSPTQNADRYLVHVLVNVGGAPEKGQLTITLPGSLVSQESDTTDDIRHLAFGYKAAGGDISSLPFAKLDSGQTRSVAGPMEWVVVRNKYFLFALISPDSSIAGAAFTGGARVAKLAPEAGASVVMPLRNGRAAFDVYMGPQEYERLRSLGHGLDRVNPYAGWLHGVVQPFATVVTRVLLWMKSTSGLGYGWVIVIFGVVVRLLLWPLNQTAMRTSIRMQRLQPELAEVQKKYKNEPEKQRDALVKLYAAHGMTPFSPMMGCLPMMIPMPILFALYFVFLNTIEFRGVSFLWMRDISAADPYYITPLVMGLSMFALSWIGMRGTPPTPQTRMMSYMMPVVLTFMFLRFAAGLNLYYAVQNLAALPQQWLLARERAGLSKGGGGGSGGAIAARGKT